MLTAQIPDNNSNVNQYANQYANTIVQVRRYFRYGRVVEMIQGASNLKNLSCRSFYLIPSYKQHYAS